MIRTLIIDDEQHCINTLINHLKNYDNYEICAVAKNIEDAIELTEFIKPNLIFLDINLGSKTGFDYLNAIYPKINFDIIFTTAYNNHAIEAIRFSAIDYLLKPISASELQNALSQAESEISKRELLTRLQSLEYNMKNKLKSDKFIHISTLQTVYKISTKDILYLKSENNYTDFYLTDANKITASKTLKYYDELLSGSHFFRVNKSFLINTEHIKTYQKRSRKLILSDNTRVIVAFRRQKDFIAGHFAK